MAVLPLNFIPGVGEIVGTVGEWICIVPAALAIDYAGAFHGGRESHFWQPALALVLKKLFETALDTPIVVVTIGVIVGGSVGAATLTYFGGVPVPLVSAGVVSLTLVAYLGLKGVRDGIGDLIFEGVYILFTPELDEGAATEARQMSLPLQPGVSGVPAAFGMIATVSGSKPTFDWRYAIPIVGPVWRAEAHAKDIQTHVRRYAHEVMLVDKADLKTMDTVATFLGTTQGYAYAAAHVGLGIAVTLLAAGLVVSVTDDPQRNENQPAADLIGNLGLGSAVFGGAAIVVGLTADRLQPVLVPLAWLAAE